MELEEVTDAPVDGQFRRYVERSIQAVKKLFRTMTRTLKGEKLPVLEREAATLLLEIACFETNAIPFGIDEEKLYICSNDILVPNLILKYWKSLQALEQCELGKSC